MKGTYQVQTNHSVQTIETSIWAIRSTSKRRGAERWEGDLQKCDCPIQGQVQIVKLPNLTYPLDVDPMTQIEVFIVCTERLVTQYAEHSMCRRAVHNTTGNIDICTY